MYKYTHKLILGIVCVLLSSCVDLDSLPLNSDTDITYWYQPNAAIETVNSCYSLMSTASEILYNDGATDNAYVRKNETHSIANGTYSTADGYVESFWKNRYFGIKMCNQLTDNIDKVPDLNDELRNRYLAEIRVIRALHYYDLCFRYGDVPYVTQVLSVKEADKVNRTERAVVINHILDELNDIIDHHYLPNSYDEKDRGRITHWTAMAVKARILLGEGHFSEIYPITKDIIENSGYELYPDYGELFTVKGKNNKEVMLEVAYALNLRENQANYEFLPPSLAGISNITPVKNLVDSYIMLNGKAIHEDGSNYVESDPWTNRDPRLEATICYDGGYYVKADGSKHTVITSPESDNKDRLQPGRSVTTTPTGYYFKKYYDNQATTAQKSGLNYPLIRYADVLLMHAEACAETNTLNKTEWDKTIKLIRERAGFTDTNAIDFPSGKTQQQLIEIVRNERRSELAMEGLRMFDLFRWKIADKVMNSTVYGMYIGESSDAEDGYYIVEKRTFDPKKHYMWPIPQSEKDINANLGQNPNW